MEIDHWLDTVLQMRLKPQGREKEDDQQNGRRTGVSAVKVRLKIQFLRGQERDEYRRP